MLCNSKTSNENLLFFVTSSQNVYWITDILTIAYFKNTVQYISVKLKHKWSGEIVLAEYCKGIFKVVAIKFPNAKNALKTGFINPTQL